MVLLALTDLPADTEGTVVGLEGGYGMRARLRSMGIFEGTRLRKVSAIGWRGPVVVLVARTQLAIGYGIARRVVVRVDAPAADTPRRGSP
jgi:ferrous iron transport protein A